MCEYKIGKTDDPDYIVLSDKSGKIIIQKKGKIVFESDLAGYIQKWRSDKDSGMSIEFENENYKSRANISNISGRMENGQFKYNNSNFDLLYREK